MNDALIFRKYCSSNDYSYEKDIIEQSIRHFCNPNTEVLAVYKFDELNFHPTCEDQYIILLDKKGNIVISNQEHNFSKTAKVVMKDDYACKECEKPVNFIGVSISHIDNPEKPAVFFGHLDYDEEHFTIMTKDHIIPKAEGGNNSMVNLQCLCYDCNQDKADKLDGIVENACPDNPTKYRIDPNDPRLNNKKRQRNFVKVDEEELNLMRQKIKDFYNTRKNIKNTINRIPWYYKLLGVDRYIEKKIKEYLVNKGYYSNGGENNVKIDDSG
ncbi:hypothetical protein PBI_SCTP2_538 [Salicola phage SCTP-2]|nr:hypothetical protein PBI_SCTP2_538 [Salicola phage SCTP-2]